MRPSPRHRTPGLGSDVTRALISPSGLALAGAGAGLALVAGAPLVLVPVAAGVGWAVRVAAAALSPQRPRPERIDPFTVGEPWRRFVQDALQARNRFAEAVRSARAGPLQDRLAEIGSRVDVGVDEVWRIARRGHELAQARRTLDRAGITRRLAALESADTAEPPEAPGAADALLSPDSAGSDAAERTLEALRAQLGTVERLDRVIEETESRLRLLDARLDESVARTLELSVQAGDPGLLGGIGADIDDVVLEMEALRQAIEETGSGPGHAGPAPGSR